MLSPDHAAHGGAQIGFRHQRAADQEAVGVVAQLADLPVVVDARLADHRHAMRHARGQLTGAVQVDAQIAQIAVVDADHARLQRDRALQLFFTDHFGQHAHVQAVGHRRQLAVLLVGQHRQHQQDGVGLIVARRKSDTGR